MENNNVLLIKNATILDVEEKREIEADILIKNGKIAAIEQTIDIYTDNIIDAGKRYVTSGLVDCHTHLGLKGDSQGFEGIDHNEKNDPVTPQMRGLDGINPLDVTVKEALAHGVTTVGSGPGSTNVFGGTFACIKTYGECVDDMLLSDSVAMKSAFGENVKRTYNDKKKTPMTRMGIAALFREYIFKTKEYLRDKESGKNPKFDIKLEALIPVVKKEIPVKAHVHRADDIMTAVRLAKELDLDMTLDHCTCAKDVFNSLMKVDYPMIMGPSLGHRGKIELQGKGFDSVALFSNAGKKIAITTDAPVVPLQYLNVCAGLAVRAGMDKWEALRAISLYPASFMKQDHKIGSIKVEKDADIVIWNDYPLSNFALPNYVLINGEVVEGIDK
ncbi:MULTISPECIES: amidohydrolase [Fusobacterium]|jgi:imidazolonepropionase-like amidohydrolase|uniref:amidohydrolase n=1 Tax=Fusobacterium TaxID=848 RepID=UPI000E83E1DB|nr:MULTISPECIES: amidohydrolase [Fusobacterium]HBJ77650.1 amidohydrolase [Fusobacterium sp.]